ncbi:protein of unknown function DUF4283 - like 10 [Theobroma cacao]|nr:protein of unknown function DUF4283 - like 10 [Theobroma cacao]
MECNIAESNEEDFEYGSIKGFPSITVFDKRQEMLARRWQNSVIMQMLNHTISYWSLCVRVASLWRPKGKYDIVDLADNRFIVCFVDQEDFLRALLNGPWMLVSRRKIRGMDKKLASTANQKSQDQWGFEIKIFSAVNGG